MIFPFLRLTGLRRRSCTAETEVPFFAAPDAGLAVGIVADGYGDVAHGCPLDRVGFWLLFSIVRRGRLILCKHSYEKILAPDLKIEPSAKQLELL